MKRDCEHILNDTIDSECVYCNLAIAEKGLDKQRELRLKAEGTIKELEKLVYYIKPNTEPDGYGEFCEAMTYKDAFEDDIAYDKWSREEMAKACKKIKAHPDWEYGENAFPSPRERTIVAGCLKAVRDLQAEVVDLEGENVLLKNNIITGKDVNKESIKEIIRLNKLLDENNRI